MIVRLATAADEQAILDLTQMDVEELLPHLTFDAEITRATFRRAVAGQGPIIFVAEEKGVVIGFLLALVNEYAFTAGFFTSQEVIYVHPERRGTRAAALLLKVFNDWSDHIGAREVFVGVANGRKHYKFANFIQRLFYFDVVGLYLRRIRS